MARKYNELLMEFPSDVQRFQNGGGNYEAGYGYRNPWGYGPGGSPVDVPAGNAGGAAGGAGEATKVTGKAGGGMDMAGAGEFIGDVAALATSKDKYRGGQQGRAIGGGAGMVIGGIFGQPGLGQKVGSLAGGLIGEGQDNENMRMDNRVIQREKYNKLNMQANINPYGSDNTQYMHKGGIAKYKKGGKVKKGYHRMPDGSMMKNSAMYAEGGFVPGGGGGDPEYAARVEAANKEAKRFAVAHKMITGEDTHTGGMIPEYIDSSTGLPYKAAPTKQKALTVPVGVGLDQIKNEQGLYFYEDPHTGDTVDIAYEALNTPHLAIESRARAKEKALSENPLGNIGRPATVPGTNYREGGIHIKPENRGKFTKWANRHGMGVQQAASRVMAHKDEYSSGVVKMANFAKNFGGKKEYGGNSESQEPTSMINVEKGELLINPINLDIIREYENPNRYKAHSDNPQFEPVGNFTMVAEGEVVIPKKFAHRYKYGDELARTSIVAEILKDQRINGTPTADDVPQAASGMLVGDPPFGEDPNDPFTGPPSFMDFPGGGAGRTPPPGGYLGGIKGAADMWRAYSGDLGRLPERDMEIGDTEIPGNQFADFHIADETPEPGVVRPGRNNRLIASRIIGAIPTGYGITKALGIDPFLRYDENTQMDAAKSYLQGMETSPNIEASKAAIRRTNATRNQVLNNFNSPSTRAEVAANNAAGLKAEGELIQNASNIAMDARNRKRQGLATLEEAQGAGRLNMRQQLMKELRMDKANRENMVHMGLSEGATNYQQGVMDDERIRSLNEMAEYYKLNPYEASLLGDKGAYMEKILETLGGLKGQPGRRTPAAAGKQTDIESYTRDRDGNLKQSKRTKIYRR